MPVGVASFGAQGVRGQTAELAACRLPAGNRASEQTPDHCARSLLASPKASQSCRRAEQPCRRPWAPGWGAPLPRGDLGAPQLPWRVPGCSQARARLDQGHSSSRESRGHRSPLQLSALPCSLLAGPGAGLAVQEASAQRQPRSTVVAAAISGGRSGGSSTGRRRGRAGHTAEPQPDLQAWLQKLQGLAAADAAQHARRLAHIFGGDQQAALASLPATFEFCRSQGLSGLETAQLLDRIAQRRHENVARFATTAQLDWQLLDGCIAAHVLLLQQAGERLPKHASLASLLRSSKDAAQVLAMPPGHVDDWVKALSALLPDAADVGRLLLAKPQAARTPPETTLAVLRWFVEALGVPPAELAAFVSKAAPVMNYKAATLAEKLAALQAALPPEQARRLVQKQPVLLASHSVTIREALAWLMQAFGGDAERVLAVLETAPTLLTVSADGLQRRADFLQRQHGWRRVRGRTGQLGKWIEARPNAFSVDLAAPDTAAKLLLLAGGQGLPLADALERCGAYLHIGLETAAARCALVQARCCPLSECMRSTPAVLCCRRSTGAPCSRLSDALPCRRPPAGARALAAVRPGRRALADLAGQGPQSAARLRRRHRGGGRTV